MPTICSTALKQAPITTRLRGLEKIQAAVLAINFADDELNTPELGIFDRAKQHVRNGQFVLIPASSQTQGHMTIRKASVYAPAIADFLAKLPTSP